MLMTYVGREPDNSQSAHDKSGMAGKGKVYNLKITNM